MSWDMAPYVGLALAAVFISSVAQAMLKKEALREHESVLREYLNPLVVGGYVLMLATTLMMVFAFRGIPLSMGPVLEATSYLYVTVFGIVLFKEKVGAKKLVALALIVAGICIYSLGV